MHSPRRSGTSLCTDQDLGYERNRTRFASGEGLQLDESYRLAHLPLVAPDHPRVIATQKGKDYTMGRHPETFSLVLPIPGDALLRSAAFQELDADLRSERFATKIAWDLLERRQEKLHATLCSLPPTGVKTPVISERQRRDLGSMGPVDVEVRGVFSGTMNVGRLYLRTYPERRHGANAFQQIQCALGCRETDLYLVGIYNFTDDLDAAEAIRLERAVERWWDRPILRFQADHVRLLRATDDLVLDSAVVEKIPLT